MQVIARSYAS